MGKVVRLKGDSQKNIVKLMDGFGGKYSRWVLWQDFIIMSAIAISNAVDPVHREGRERDYMARAEKYSEKEISVFFQMMVEMTQALERDPDQDFLGDLFMSLNLGNEWQGQFFTPYTVCRAMAAINSGPNLAENVAKKGWVSVNDPACGAGALLIAFANECTRQKVNYQTSALFIAQDVDFLAGCMCYIQLSLLGCPGYVVIDNTLTRPAVSNDPRGLLPVDSSNVWYTPFYFRDVWHYRRLWAQMNLRSRHFVVAPKGRAEKQAQEPLVAGCEVQEVEGTGQLTLF